MARTGYSFTCALLVVLILACDARTSEARMFTGSQDVPCKECKLQVEEDAKGPITQLLAPDRSVGVMLDDPRPSTPGHSPGVGHGILTESGPNNK